ncbi:isoprenoid synthase domain-containing protein [Lactifluus volemus]|nr:isoprenoid synthase domain-containing protein [Lactifluus volemus]
MSKIHLPDPLAQWPWPRKLSEHYTEVKQECDAWLQSFGVLDAKSQKAFDLCNFPLLGALVFPFLDKYGVRVACDLMVIYFIFDEFTDKANGDGARGEPKLGEITRRFWLRAIKVLSYSAQKWFIKTFAEYVYAVADEAADRAKGNIRGIEDYLKLRRLTIAGYPAYPVIEASLDIPDEVIAHPAMDSLCAYATESLVLTNRRVIQR